MPPRASPTEAAGKLARTRSSTLTSSKNGAVPSSDGRRRAGASPVIRAGQADRSPNATPVPLTPNGNKRFSTGLPTSTANNRRISLPPNSTSTAPLNVLVKYNSPRQKPRETLPNNIPSRPSAPIPASMASSVASSVRSIRRSPQLSEQQQQQQQPPTFAGTASQRRVPNGTGTPARPQSMINLLTSPAGYNSEQESISTPSKRQTGGPGQPSVRQRTVSHILTSPQSNTTSKSKASARPVGQPQLTRASTYSHSSHSATGTSSSTASRSTRSGYTQSNVGLDLLSDPNAPLSNAPSVWEGDGSTSFEMETEVAELGDMLDEDVATALHAVQIAHTKKLTHYKRLLEQAQSSSASQLHALQAELRLLRATLEAERAVAHKNELERDRDRLAIAFRQGQPMNEEEFDLARALRGDGKGTFNDAEVKRAVRSLKLPDRLRLIGLILDSCIPGDITKQIRLLEKYAKSTFDVLAHLPINIALKTLEYLSVPELLNVETVSRKWSQMVHHPALWRYHCLLLTSTDPVPIRPPTKPEDWEPLYRSLHHREANWKYGLPQQIRFLNGHTNFCTTLLLKGKRLISGSYDETIRVWDIETGEEKKCLQVKKPVSCLDFLVEEEVFVVGFHDVGRVHLFSSVTYNPLQQLSGHLYGIRAVALSTKYLVSAGADKALVCWDWRQGTKIVRFGQQTNLNIGVQILGSGGDEAGERFCSVTIDGIVRVFSIKRREMISQFSLNALGAGDPLLSAKIAPVGANSNNMLQWFAAKGNQMTCATKSVILHIEWSEEPENPALATITSPTSGTSSPTTSSGPRTPTTSTPPVTSRKSGVFPGMQSRTSSANVTPIRKSTSGSRPSLSRTPTTPITPIGTSPRHGTPQLVLSAKKPSVVTPRIVAVVETPDIAVGAVDPRKRRVVTATRFSSRTGADRRIFVSTHLDKRSRRNGIRANSGSDEDIEEDNLEDETVSLKDFNATYKPSVDFDTTITALGGAWGALAHVGDLPSASLSSIDGLLGKSPKGFEGLATSKMNPMAMALSHEEVVVGCADGTIYVMSFVGYRYSKARELLFDDPTNDTTNLIEADGVELEEDLSFEEMSSIVDSSISGRRQK